MAFVKLDCGILNSTTWVEKDIRDIFITSLLMANPIELTDPAEQINIRNLDKTGFVVPPGWYGEVKASSLGIIRQAMMDQERGLVALERLGEPEQESRTPDYDGRRMVRVEGGFLILNYQKYRDKDHTAKERQRRYREKKKREKEQKDQLELEKPLQESRRDVTLCDVTTTQAEAEVEADSKDITTLSGKPDRKQLNLEGSKALNYLNMKTDSSFKPVESNLALIRARLQEGYTLEDICNVVDSKYDEWVGTEQAQYLRPKTLFNATNFSQYHGQLGMKNGSHSKSGKSASDKLTERLQESAEREGFIA